MTQIHHEWRNKGSSTCSVVHVAASPCGDVVGIQVVKGCPWALGRDDCAAKLREALELPLAPLIKLLEEIWIFPFQISSKHDTETAARPRRHFSSLQTKCIKPAIWQSWPPFGNHRSTPVCPRSKSTVPFGGQGR
ncbi:hypothetical protein Q3G72_032913 [Acer saccharum]|nr:hypothetical protein Q3G72_032913 [Acer saccharum]